MSTKPYIKPIRQKMTNTWSWTWRCPRKDHALYSWCGGAFDTWEACLKDVLDHIRTEHT
jgi:hypothetical protein